MAKQAQSTTVKAPEDKKALKRPPVVVVMGHVDHGKTTLLDRIRNTKVADREAGGITQAVGAYEVIHKEERMTFIDTPGHEAFARMRARGARIADVAVLVVAADDGVKPQTKEAIKVILEAKIPYVVALNKIDKVADLGKVKNELAENGILLEGYGGSVSFQPISAKTGEGVQELLDLILLTADVEELTMDTEKAGEGFILEATSDNRRGIVVTGILKEGVLRVGDTIVAGAASGKLRQLHNFMGVQIKEVVPSSPVLMLGFTSLPLVGEMFRVAPLPLHPISQNNAALTRTYVGVPRGKDTLVVPILLKADVTGALEALLTMIQQLPIPPHTGLDIVDQSVGEITDGDVQLAVATNAIIVGFHTTLTRQADTLAKAQKVKVLLSDVTYELIKMLETALRGKDAEDAKGELEVLAIFGEPKGTSQVVGGEVKRGEIRTNTPIAIQRKGTVIGEGKIVNLQCEKKDAPVVLSGKQCGMLVESEVVIKVGDTFLIK